MALPLLAIYGVAMGAGAVGAGGVAFNKRRARQIDALFAEAETYCRAKQRSYLRKRRACIERMRSHAQMIRAAVQEPIGAMPVVPAELPAQQGAEWEALLSRLRSLPPTRRFAMSDEARRRVWQQLGLMSRRAQTRKPEGNAWLAVTAGAAAAYDGVTQAMDAQKAFQDAQEKTLAARLDADQRISAIEAVRDDLEMRWDNILVPIIHRAVGPPVDGRSAALVLRMADELTTRAEELLKGGRS